MSTEDWASEVAAAVPAALARWFTDEERAALVDIPVIAVDEIPDPGWLGKPRRLWGQFRDTTATRTDEPGLVKDRRVLISRALFEDCPDPAVRRERLEETLYHELAHALGWNHGGVLDRNWGDGSSRSSVGPTNWTADVTDAQGSPA